MNQAIKRNEKRFPIDFMFQLTSQELSDWKSQNVISNKEKMGMRKPPYVFTELCKALHKFYPKNSELLFLQGWMIKISPWYFNLEYDDIGDKYLRLAFKHNPDNLLFKWAPAGWATYGQSYC